MTDNIGCKNGCGKAGVKARGLCPSCHVKLCTRVREGKTTWDKLIKAGKCLAAKGPLRAKHGHPWNRRYARHNGQKAEQRQADRLASCGPPQGAGDDGDMEV